MKILVAEDDHVLRRVIARSLSALGHHVLEAADGEEAWLRLRAEPIRIVISDWIMPAPDGLELCRRIRRDPAARYVYFILLTVKDATEANKHEAADAGVDDFLTKPLNSSELWLRLRVAERLIAATARVRELESLLPICTYCKKIRGDGNSWQQIESYLREHTDSKLSHSICPDCYQNVVIPQMRADGIQPPAS